MSMADRIAVMGSGRVQQIDAPIDLYQRPATLFVAGFIGTSNQFPGQAVEGGIAAHDTVLPGTAHGAPVSGRAVLVVRPEDTRLVDEAAASVSGTVVDTQFYGGVSTVAVTVPGHDAPVLHTRPGAPEVERGAVVHLAWDAAKAVVLAG